MSRRKGFKKRIILPDPIYNSKLVSMIINKILKEGKKSIAQYIMYKSMEKIENTTKKDPLEVLQKAIENITPSVELKSRRIGGGTYNIPIDINKERGTSLGLSFLIKCARKRAGRKFISKLSLEIIDAYNNSGSSVKKKEELHKMALANKALASLRF